MLIYYDSTVQFFNQYTTRTQERVQVRPTAGTYLKQLCADTECHIKDLPGAMDDRDG